jgi:hypothetical protein
MHPGSRNWKAVAGKQNGRLFAGRFQEKLMREAIRPLP